MRILYGVNGEGMGHATRSRVVIDALLEDHDVRVVSPAAPTRSSPRRCRTWTRSSARRSRWRRARSSAGRPCVRTCSSPARSSRDTVRDWVARTREWRPDVVITDFEPLTGGVRPLQPHAAGRGRQHQHARPLPPRRRDRRRRARGLHDRARRSPTRWSPARSSTSSRPSSSRRWRGRHDPGAADRAAGDRGRRAASAASTWSSTRAASRTCSRPCAPAACRAASTGCGAGRTADEVDGNLEYRPRSSEGFVEDLRTARGVVAGRRLLAAQRGRLPGQAGALDPAARAVRAADERALSGARRIRPLCRRRWPSEVLQRLPGRARRVRAGALGLRAGRQRGRRSRPSSGSPPRRPRRTARRVRARAPGGPEARVNRAAIGAGAAAVGAAGVAIWCGQYPTAQLYGRDDLPRQRGRKRSR